MAEYIFPTSARGVSDNFQAHKNRTPPSVNPGTDYTCGYGSTVVAVKAGTVNLADNGNDGSGGRMVGINHGDGTVTQYLHLSQVEVSVGQYIEQGQEIARSGASGFGSDWGYGAHLHIALKINGSNVDFENYVDRASGSQPNGGEWEWWLPSSDVQLGVQQQLANRGLYGGALDGDIGPISTRAIQQELANAGYYTGDIDGIAGPLTCGALQAYARDRGGYDGPQDKILGPRSWAGFLQGLINSVAPATPAAVATVTATQETEKVKEEVVVAEEAPTITITPDTPAPTEQVVNITTAEGVKVDPKQVLTTEQFKKIQDDVAAMPQDDEDNLRQYDLVSLGFWNYATERVIKTFAMTFAAMLSTTGAVVVTSPDTANIFAQIGWAYIAGVAGVSALTSLLVALSSFKNIVTIKKK